MPFSTSGEEQIPWNGQSFARPAASLSCTACQRNSPSDSRNAMRMPLSPFTAGSFAASLFVPTKTVPPATTGLPYVCDPSSATHFTFFFVFTSHVVGSPFMVDIMLRSGVPPHIGQSPLEGSEAKRKVPARATAAVAAISLFRILGSYLFRYTLMLS